MSIQARGTWFLVEQNGAERQVVPAEVVAFAPSFVLTRRYTTINYHAEAMLCARIYLVIFTGMYRRQKCTTVESIAMSWSNYHSPTIGSGARTDFRTVLLTYPMSPCLSRSTQNVLKVRISSYFESCLKRPIVIGHHRWPMKINDSSLIGHWRFTETLSQPMLSSIVCSRCKLRSEPSNYM
jgi:hypothetical protein